MMYFPPIYFGRPNGLELQSRYYCSNCGLFLAYYIQDSVSSEITDDEAQIFYLLEGGLCARPSVFLHQQQIMVNISLTNKQNML